MSVLLVCDAGAGVGLGHAMRCAALGAEFGRTGRIVRMRVPPGGLDYVPERVKTAMPVEEGDVSEAGRSEIAVVDSYRIGAGRTVPADSLVAFDDGASTPPVADLLVNAAADDRYYAGRTAPGCRALVGPRHAPVDRRFAAGRRASVARRAAAVRIETVLVSFGGDDAADATGRVVDLLADRGIAVDVAIGSGARHLGSVLARAAPGVRVHVDCVDMPALMTRADLAVGAGGTTAWERCVMGLPTLVARLAANQDGVVDALVRAGAARDLGAPDAGFSERVAAAFEMIAADPGARAASCAAAAALCDGHGAKRIVLATAGTARDGVGRPVGLRAADAGDAKWLHELQLRPETRRHARDPSVPGWDVHRVWLDALLDDATRTLAIVERDGIAVGFVRLDPIGSGLRFEVSIAVEPSFHGQGIGTAALRLARRLARDSILEATVLDPNRASRALFENCGFVPAGPQRLESRPS